MKIAVFVPMYRSTSAQCASIIQQAVNAAACAGHQVTHTMHADALVDEGRNFCLGRHANECDYAIFIDDDMKPEEQSINKIVALDRPVASCLLSTRAEPVELVIRIWNEKLHGFSHAENFRTNYPVEGKHPNPPFAVGAAFLCIRRDAIDALKEYYLTARDWIEADRSLMDRLRVRSENREVERARKEVIRRELYKNEYYLRIFDRDFQGGERRVSEDITFSMKLMQLGIPITIDPTIRVTHTGERDYSWEDYIPPTLRAIYAAAS